MPRDATPASRAVTQRCTSCRLPSSASRFRRP